MGKTERKPPGSVYFKAGRAMIRSSPFRRNPRENVSPESREFDPSRNPSYAGCESANSQSIRKTWSSDEARKASLAGRKRDKEGRFK